MKNYYLSLIDQPRSHQLLVTDRNTVDYEIATLYRDILENHPKSRTSRCMVFPLYIIPNEDLSLFRKYAIFIENQEITSIPNYEEIIPENCYSKSEEILYPPDFSDDEYEN